MRNKVKSIFLCVAVCFISFLFFANSVRASTNIQAVFSQLFHVPTEKFTINNIDYSCGNLGCIATNNGKTLYVLKTETGDAISDEDRRSVLYCYTDYQNSTAHETHIVQSSLGHGNGMSYLNGELYVAGLTDKIWKLSTTGEITGTYSVIDKSSGASKKVSSIAYFKKSAGSFIVGVGKTSEYLMYGIGTFQGNNFVISDYFYVTNTGYSSGQDIFYTYEHLYINTTNIVTGQAIMQNKILVIDMGEAADTTVNNFECYTPAEVINMNGKTSEVIKFEAEGICKDSSGNLLIGLNCATQEHIKNYDFIYRITNFSTNP